LKIYVTNLRSEVTDDDLRELFETQGEVLSAEISKTKTTNESAGFGFVVMKSYDDAISARKELDGKMLNGNPIKIFDRRSLSDRRGAIDRRLRKDRRIINDRHDLERRQNIETEVMVNMMDEIKKRKAEGRKNSDRRNSGGRRSGDRRSGSERRQLVT